MATSYKKLFKLLIEREMKSKDLAEITGLSASTISAMKHSTKVAKSSIDKICAALQCTPEDIMEEIPDPPKALVPAATTDPEIYARMSEIMNGPQWARITGNDPELARKIAEHRTWLQTVRRERPNPNKPFKVGLYIRYFNQTRYENYLEHHKKQLLDSIKLCPLWEFVDFYIDNGSTAPNMESASEWSRLLDDCIAGKVDLIITQKVSNISKRTAEVTFCARILAAQPHPIGIYFISEDMFTLASYYMEDLQDDEFFPAPSWQILPDDEEEVRCLHD